MLPSEDCASTDVVCKSQSSSVWSCIAMKYHLLVSSIGKVSVCNNSCTPQKARILSFAKVHGWLHCNNTSMQDDIKDYMNSKIRAFSGVHASS